MAPRAWSTDPRIAADGQSVYVIWEDFRNGTFPMVSDIYFNRSLDGGTTWLPTDVRLNVGVAPGATLALDHDIAVSGSVVYVVWEDQRNGSNGQGRDVYLNRSVSAAELHSFRQFPPSANPFIAVIARPQNDRIRSGIGGKKRRANG